MKSKKEIKKWLLENAVDEYGNLELSGLDFGDFNGKIYISSWKVKNDLFQSKHEVGGSLWQNNQTVRGSLDQDDQTVGNSIFQRNQNFCKSLYNHRVKDDEYIKEQMNYGVVVRKLKRVTKEKLRELGYMLEE